ncbi:MAG: sulfite exporter TauE/SafE family protein [Anaerolinea sp.]|nr:sulfite exporter TauE/SafE family protein [Anaerolinea sp.]
MDILLLAAVIFAAALVQAISGSGIALVAMPLLIGMMPPVEAGTLVSLMAITVQVIMLTRYFRALTLRGLWRLIVGALIGIPIGIYALSRLDEQIILTALGILLVVYSLYSLVAPQIPAIRGQGWGFIFGLISGLLHGAYNTGGPPYVIYGVGQRWPLAQFKSNLQALLMVNSSSVVIAHLLAGHITASVLNNYAIAVPVIIMGALTGFFLDRYINEELFRRIVLIVLLLIGINMLI